MKAMVAFECL